MAVKDINIIGKELQESAIKFRKTLLLFLVFGLEKYLPYLSVRPGIQYKEIVGALDGIIQFKPHTPGDYSGTQQLKITPRELEVYHGSVVQPFDPVSLQKSMYGSLISGGKELEGADFNKQLLGHIMKELSKNLAFSLFGAKRDAAGKTSKDLFNGYDTITAQEITAGSVSKEKGNFFSLTEAINADNAVDILKEFYRSSTEELRELPCKLYVPVGVSDAYNDCYQATVGSVPYNNEFKKTFLEGSNNLCEIVPMAAKKGSTFLHLTPKENMLVGVNQMSDLEKIEVRRGDDPFLLQFVAAVFFGVNFESVDPRVFNVCKLFTA